MAAQDEVAMHGLEQAKKAKKPTDLSRQMTLRFTAFVNKISRVQDFNAVFYTFTVPMYCLARIF